MIYQDKYGIISKKRKKRKNMKDKYNMTLEENIFVAKRNMVDSIWKSANLEGIAVTYPETEIIIEGMAVQNMYIKDINSVVNLKHAWNFLLENIEYPIDLGYVCKLHQYLGEANVIPFPGVIRTSGVNMGGTSWKPEERPDIEEVKTNMKKILEISSPTERAISMFLYLSRQQLFYDGNKRIATLAANQIMIQNGVGLLSIPIEKQKEFKEKLIRYYETNQAEGLKKFLYDFCIEGIHFEKARENLVSHNSWEKKLSSEGKDKGFSR